MHSTGIIGAVAKDFFNSEVTMELVNQMEEEERTGKKEHVVFLVTQKPLPTEEQHSKLSATPHHLIDTGKESDQQTDQVVRSQIV